MLQMERTARVQRSSIDKPCVFPKTQINFEISKYVNMRKQLHKLTLLLHGINRDLFLLTSYGVKMRTEQPTKCFVPFQ